MLFIKLIMIPNFLVVLLSILTRLKKLTCIQNYITNWQGYIKNKGKIASCKLEFHWLNSTLAHEEIELNARLNDSQSNYSYLRLSHVEVGKT